MMKRKIYDKLIKWKEESNGEVALLIDGARRIGKSYIVEQFAKENYKSYILIDFNKAGDDIKKLFDNYLDGIPSRYYFLNGGCLEFVKILKHFIPNLEYVISKDKNHLELQYYVPFDLPIMLLKDKLGVEKAQAFCNIHGLWEGEMD